MKHCSLNVSWDDPRYIEGNKFRKSGCKSGYVHWTEAHQFWVPNFFVLDKIELASSNLTSLLIKIRGNITNFRGRKTHLSFFNTLISILGRLLEGAEQAWYRSITILWSWFWTFHFACKHSCHNSVPNVL